MAPFICWSFSRNDGNGNKHPLGLVEGATENASVVRAPIDNLIGRGLDPTPTVCRLFIIDGTKALSKACPSTPGVAAGLGTPRCR